MEKATLASAALGGSAIQTEEPQDTTPHRRWSPVAKICTAVLGAGLSVWVAISTLPASKLQLVNNSTTVKQSDSAQRKTADPKSAPQPSNDAQKPSAPEGRADEAAISNVPKLQQADQQKPVAEDFVLDHYPKIVKDSLLDTARGVAIFKSTTGETAPPSQAQNDKSGNLFSLLESASSKSPNSPPPPDEIDSASSYNEADEPVAMESEPVSASEEESRREEIRNRFLEAIRAAAERRQSETDIEEP
jgi:hypothetical protein